MGREDTDILQQMYQLALGRDPYGHPVDRDTRMLALDRYIALKKELETSRLESERQGANERMQTQQLQAQREQRDKELELERERLRIEAERVETQKAELAVRALEAVLKSPPESAQELNHFVRQLGVRLTGTTLSIEDKSTK